MQAVHSANSAPSISSQLEDNEGDIRLKNEENTLLGTLVRFRQNRSPIYSSPECCRMDFASVCSLQNTTTTADPTNTNRPDIYESRGLNLYSVDISTAQSMLRHPLCIYLAKTVTCDCYVLRCRSVYSPAPVTCFKSIWANHPDPESAFEEKQLNLIKAATIFVAGENVVMHLTQFYTARLHKEDTKPYFYMARKFSLLMMKATVLRMSEFNQFSPQKEITTCWISAAKLLTKHYYECTVEISRDCSSMFSSEYLELKSCHTHLPEAPKYSGAGKCRPTVLQNLVSQGQLEVTDEDNRHTSKELDFASWKAGKQHSGLSSRHAERQGCEDANLYGDTLQIIRPAGRTISTKANTPAQTEVSVKQRLPTEHGDPVQVNEASSFQSPRGQSIQMKATSSRVCHNMSDSGEDTSFSSEYTTDEKDASFRTATVRSLLQRHEQLTNELMETNKSIQLLCKRTMKHRERRLGTFAVDAYDANIRKASNKHEKLSDVAAVFDYFEKLRLRSREASHHGYSHRFADSTGWQENSVTMKEGRKQAQQHSINTAPPISLDTELPTFLHSSSAGVQCQAHHPLGCNLSKCLPHLTTRHPLSAAANFLPNAHGTSYLTPKPMYNSICQSSCALHMSPSLESGHNPRHLTPVQTSSPLRFDPHRTKRRYQQSGSTRRKYRSHSRQRSRSRNTSPMEQRPQVSAVVPAGCMLYSCPHSKCGISAHSCCTSPKVGVSLPTHPQSCCVIPGCSDTPHCSYPRATSGVHHPNVKDGIGTRPECRWAECSSAIATWTMQPHSDFSRPHTALTDMNDTCGMCLSKSRNTNQQYPQVPLSNTAPNLRQQISQTQLACSRLDKSTDPPHKLSTPMHNHVSHWIDNQKNYPLSQHISQGKVVTPIGFAAQLDSEQMRHVEFSESQSRISATTTERSCGTQYANCAASPRLNPKKPLSNEYSCKLDDLQDMPRNSEQQRNNLVGKQQIGGKMPDEKNDFPNQTSTDKDKLSYGAAPHVGQTGPNSIHSNVTNPALDTEDQLQKVLHPAGVEHSASSPQATTNRSMIAARAHLQADPITAGDWKEVERRFDQLQRDKATLETHLRRLPRNNTTGKVGLHAEEAELSSSIAQLDKQLSALRLLLQRRNAETRRLGNGSK